MNTNQFKSSLLFFASLYAFLFLPLMPLWAQGLQSPLQSLDDDLVGPRIELKPMTRSIRAGEPLTINASIDDSSGIEKVTLFYRPVGTTNYSSLQMTLGAASNYSATISAQEVSEPTMEYYIQATDKARNMSVRGVKQFPLSLTILARILQKKDPVSFGTKRETQTASVALKKPWYKKWWVWTIAAVLVGGAVAAGGSSGGGSTPTTGRVTISSPVP